MAIKGWIVAVTIGSWISIAVGNCGFTINALGLLAITCPVVLVFTMMVLEPPPVPSMYHQIPPPQQSAMAKPTWNPMADARMGENIDMMGHKLNNIENSLSNLEKRDV